MVALPTHSSILRFFFKAFQTTQCHSLAFYAVCLDYVFVANLIRCVSCTGSYWQGRDYKTQETWTPAQHWIWQKQTLPSSTTMPRLWLRDNSIYVRHEVIVPELFHINVGAIPLGKERKGLFEAHTHIPRECNWRCVPTHLPHQKLTCQVNHCQPPSRLAPAPDTRAQHRGGEVPWATNTGEVQEQHNTTTEPN